MLGEGSASPPTTKPLPGLFAGLPVQGRRAAATPGMVEEQGAHCVHTQCIARWGGRPLAHASRPAIRPGHGRVGGHHGLHTDTHNLEQTAQWLLPNAIWPGGRRARGAETSSLIYWPTGPVGDPVGPPARTSSRLGLPPNAPLHAAAQMAAGWWLSAGGLTAGGAVILAFSAAHPLRIPLHALHVALLHSPGAGTRYTCTAAIQLVARHKGKDPPADPTSSKAAKSACPAASSSCTSMLELHCAQVPGLCTTCEYSF